jgi:hypothetical protein
MLCLMGTVALGQEAAPAGVTNALRRLKSAPAHERASAREAVVELGAPAVDGLVAEVEQRERIADENYVGHCILALGALEAEDATDVLLDVLASNDLLLVFNASTALADIWEGKGTAQEVPKVNAALLSVLLREVPAATFYGPALALIRINAIEVSRPRGMEPQELRTNVLDWADQNPDALPPIAERPWRLNVHYLSNANDPQLARQIIEGLREQGRLDPVSSIVSLLASDGVSQEVRPDLEDLLGELTGVPFPPEGVEETAPAAQKAAAWQWQWLAKLQNQDEQRYVDYAWARLEESLRSYSSGPSEEGADEVKFYRSAVLHQLSGPGDVPAGASRKAGELLRKPLELKKRVATAVEFLEREPPPTDFEKSARMNAIAEAVGTPQGREVGLMFLDRLAKLAYRETNVNVAQRMGRVLSQVSGVPCDLESISRPRRRENLQKWAQTVAQRGIAIELPAG